MKRIGLVCLGLVLAANTANAQLTMQMSNGWSFTFSGNVNTFIYYENSNNGTTATPAGTCVVGRSQGWITKLASTFSA